MKFVVFQINVVNYFGQAKHGSFTNPEKFDQRFESAAMAITAEFRLYHDVRRCALMLRRRAGKDKLGFWIDEFANQPCRTDTIDLRAGPDNPGFTLIFLGSQPSLSLRLSSSGFEQFCRPEESIELLATGAFEKVDIVYFLEAFVKLLQLVCECFWRRFPTSGGSDEKSQR